MSDQQSAGGADRGQASTERGLASPRFGDAGVTTILAREELLDHAKHPRNRGPLQDADVVQEEANPLCGDVVTMYAKINPTSYTLQAISFVGSGCIISQAAASLLTEHAVEKSVEEILRMDRADMEALVGGTLSPSRVKCAMLPLIALKRGLSARQRAAVSRQ